MDKIKLNDILNLTEEEISRTKIRFMTPSGDFDPIRDVKNEGERDRVNLEALVWNRESSLSFKDGTIAIGFIRIEEDTWLMTGIVEVLKDRGYGKPADARYVERLKKFNFRVVVKFHKDFQNGIVRAENFIDGLDVFEIWNPDKSLNEKHFPGYHDVFVSYEELKKKLEISEEWKTALKSRNGVYVISDEETGKLYVGSAYGEDGIFGRWKTYVDSGYDKNEVENGKYPNKKLQELVQERGLDYIKKNFQYSILETFTDDVSNEYIIKRESFWKEVLLTRKFGYNAN